MIRKSITKSNNYIQRYRFRLLLLATFLVLFLPALAVKGLLGNLLFVTSMSFLLMQSMIVASAKSAINVWLRYLIVAGLIFIIWLEPAGFTTDLLDDLRLLLLSLFFMFVTYYLIKYMRKSREVSVNLIIVAINIYLLIGIISGSLAFFFHRTIDGAYNFPSYITNPEWVSFNYYAFITMSTVGYGDITPRLPQTQTLAYFIAITGQLYVAIIIAFLVGKLLMRPDNADKNKVG